MRAVMKSVPPQICEKVANGDCTVLVSKTAPKCEVPFKGYIYAAKSNKFLLDQDADGVMFCWDKEEHYYPFKHETEHEELFNGHIIGECIVDKIIEWQYDFNNEYYVDYPDDSTSYFPYLLCHREATCLKCSELENYGKGKPLYGWHISDLKIYDKPKELREFYTKKKCNACNKSGYESTACRYDEDCKVPIALTRAPKSWQYVEEL